MKYLILLLLVTTINSAEPNRNDGLKIHMLPDRIAKIENKLGGFTVDKTYGDKTYSEPKDLLDFVLGLPDGTKQNGLWIVTTHPTSYSEQENEKLKSLISLCVDKGIPIFTCRGSELPNGWNRTFPKPIL